MDQRLRKSGGVRGGGETHDKVDCVRQEQLLLIEVQREAAAIHVCSDPMASLDTAEISTLPEQHGGVLKPSQGGSPTGTSILQALPEVQSREVPATQ